MSGNKDPSIKLFGTTIQLTSKIEPSAVAASASASHLNILCSKQSQNIFRGDQKCSSEDGKKEEEEVCSSEECKKKKEEESDETSSSSSSKCKSISVSVSVNKTLACGRCNSMNTKFCYYNNYNVKQPRHFCKNCQRYWTAGGTMRNVPVGAGRRKNKNSNSNSNSNPNPHWRWNLQSSSNSTPLVKRLRIDDPSQVANASIWNTLGIKNGGPFFNHQSKGTDTPIQGSYMALQANPAAFSRSMAFHETAYSGC